MDQTYEEAVTEVLDILNHTKMEDVKKIPSKFIKYLKQHSSKTYIPNLDHTKKLKDMDLNPKTRALISLIYREYFCDENQKKEYDKKLVNAELEYQRELQEKYNINNIFKNKNQEITENNIMSNDMQFVEYRKSFFSKIINKLKKIFGHNRNL